ncbi:phosphate ABC transporter ATP-binding protein [Archaeoglobales archaeon]|nr:MAG: phosphate ABC transporter ATP-binding protein [Archaeoglobales archaeon]
MDLIKLERIWKSFGSICALRNVSLNIKESEVLTIIGSNGSGKTTLLRILALLEKPDSGKYYFRGKLADESLRGKITLVPQKPVVFRGTVFYNTMYGLKVRGFKNAKEKVRGALKKVGLEGYEKRNAKLLSGGEQQRVAIARALAIEPEVLLLDEPTSNIDPNSIPAIEKLIRELVDDGMTVVVATHNLFQAKRISDRVVHLHEGKIYSVGSVRNVLEEPKNEVTRKFVLGELYY